MAESRMVTRRRASRLAFTLVELLVVIAIIGVLVALLLPAVQAAREAARRSQCVNNLRQVALGILNYESSRGVLPVASPYASAAEPSKGVRTGVPWPVLIMPFAEQTPTYNAIEAQRKSLPAGATQLLQSAALQTVVTTPVSLFICPSDENAQDPILKSRGDSPSWNPQDVAGNWYHVSLGPTNPDGCELCPYEGRSPALWCCRGCSWGTREAGAWPFCVDPQAERGLSSGMFVRYPHAYKLAEITDGLSNTVMVGETLPHHSIFAGLYNLNKGSVTSHSIPLNFQGPLADDLGKNPNDFVQWSKTTGYKSRHQGGVHLAMGDGAVRFFNETIDHFVYAAIGSRAGDETVELPQ